MIDKCKGMRKNRIKMQDTCICKEVNYTPSFWKRGKIKETIDLLKYVMLSRTPLYEFLISPLLGGSENGSTSYLRVSWTAKEESKKHPSLCAFMASASCWILPVKSHFLASKCGQWGGCASTWFSQTLSHGETYFLLCWEPRKIGFQKVLMLHSTHTSQTCIKHTGCGYPLLSLCTDGLFLSRETAKNATASGTIIQVPELAFL